MEWRHRMTATHILWKPKQPSRRRWAFLHLMDVWVQTQPTTRFSMAGGLTLMLVSGWNITKHRDFRIGCGPGWRVGMTMSITKEIVPQQLLLRLRLSRAAFSLSTKDWTTSKRRHPRLGRLETGPSPLFPSPLSATQRSRSNALEGQLEQPHRKQRPRCVASAPSQTSRPQRMTERPKPAWSVNSVDLKFDLDCEGGFE